MATRNLKRLMRRIYKKDPTLDPQAYPVNFNRAVKYVNAKGKSLQFNPIFKSFFEKFYDEDIKSYLAMGHKLTHSLKKGMVQYAKEKAKHAAKAQIAAQAPAQQDYKGSQNDIQEG